MLQAIVGSVTVFSVADQNPMYFILTLLGVLMVWMFSVVPNRPAPRLMINTVLLLVVAIAGIEMLRQGVGVSAFAVFVALLLVVKLTDLRNPRDDGQIVVLCVAILISAVLTSNTLLTGVLMVIVIVLILRAVVLYQIHTVLTKSAPTSTAIDSKARVDIRAMILATGFLCGLLGSVIFVVLPRNVGMQAFGQWGPGKSVSGFADTVELGRPGLISESSTPVLDITIRDRDGFNIGAENMPAIYLRGAVLNDYDAGRWTNSPTMSLPLTSRARLVEPRTAVKPAKPIENASQWTQQFDIIMRSSAIGQTYLFTPWKTVEFKVGDIPMRLGHDFERGLFLKDGIGGRLEYSIRRVNTEYDRIDFDQFDRRDPIYVLSDAQTLDIEPAIQEFASEVLSQSGIEPDPALRAIRDDQAAVRLIENHLRSRFAYTLDAQPVPAGEDATKWFLFERKAGHCEYFASSLALMTRSIGIPARVITGYIVSDFNDVTGQFVVRESNAHAWVEAQIAPGVWKTFDGTPPADFHAIHERDPSIWRSFSKMYESIEFLWVRSVVGYDSNSRENIMGASSTDFGLTGMSESLLNRLAAGRGRLVAHSGLVAVIVFAASMFVGVVILRYKELFAGIIDGLKIWIARFRIRVFGQEHRAHDPRLVQIEKMLQRTFDRLGIPKPAWVPLKAHIEQNTPILNTLASPTRQAIADASSLLYSQAFSPDPQAIDHAQVIRIQSLLRKSEKSSAST